MDDPDSSFDPDRPPVDDLERMRKHVAQDPSPLSFQINRSSSTADRIEEECQNDCHNTWG